MANVRHVAHASDGSSPLTFYILSSPISGLPPPGSTSLRGMSYLHLENVKTPPGLDTGVRVNESSVKVGDGTSGEYCRSVYDLLTRWNYCSIGTPKTHLKAEIEIAHVQS